MDEFPIYDERTLNIGFPQSTKKVSEYVLIDWVGGPDGKIFGARWNSEVRAADREPTIFPSDPT